MDTLSNQPLVAYNNIHALPYDPFVLGRLYDLNLDLANMSQVLVDARSTTKPYKAMTRLERSAMAETLSKGRAESTTYAALFLHHAQQAIFTWTVESMPPKIIDIVSHALILMVEILTLRRLTCEHWGAYRTFGGSSGAS